MRRMHSEWERHNPRQVSQQQLADQVRRLLKSGRTVRPPSPEITEIVHDEVFTSSNNGEPVRVLTPSVEQDLIDKINQKLSSEARPILQVPRRINMSKLNKATSKVNQALASMSATSLTELNRITHAAAEVVLEAVGVKLRRETEQATCRKWNVPPWQQRVENKLKRLRREVNQLSSSKTYPKLEQRLRIGPGKTKETALEELKQRLAAEAAKLKRYKQRCTQYQDNMKFQCNEAQFYRSLQGETERIEPSSEQIDFWENIWGVPGPEPEEDLPRSETKQISCTITMRQMKESLRKMRNWKAPGVDGVHGYWLKRFTSLHGSLLEHLNRAVENGCPEWMTTGKTCLLPKDKPGDTRPVTCLSTTWKLLTSIIAKDLASYLETHNLIPDEQKGCRNKTRGCKDQLMTDQAIMKNCRRRLTNLAVTWVDFKKAYDSVSHSWILECMKAVGASDMWVQFLEREMPRWKTRIGDRMIHFRRGLFQGDSLAPLMFIICLIPSSKKLNESNMGYSLGRGKRTISHLWFMDDCKLYSRDSAQQQKQIELLEHEVHKTGMEFGVNKCGSQILRRGRIVRTEASPVISSGERLPIVEGGYKYLGMIQTDLIHHEEMKKKLTKEYKARLRKVLKTRLNAANTIKAINTWEVSILRYSAGIVKWTLEDTKKLDTRKILSAERAFNMNGDIDRLYIPRSEGGKGLMGVEDCVNQEDISLREYIHGLPDSALPAIAKETCKEPDTNSKQAKRNTRLQRKARFREKVMHGQFERQTEGVRDHESTFRWLRCSNLKRETEALIMAAQEQSLRTNSIKCHIDKTRQSDKCRMCQHARETAEHLVGGCEKLAQREYKRRHDKVAQLVHWNILRNDGIETTTTWYKHLPQQVIENQHAKVLWDFNIQVNSGNRPTRPDRSPGRWCSIAG